MNVYELIMELTNYRPEVEICIDTGEDSESIADVGWADTCLNTTWVVIFGKQRED